MLPEGRVSLSTQAAAQLRVWLREGTLAPGSMYSVQQIADRLGFSRSPVREALVTLADAGIIEFNRNRGFRVVVPTAHDVAEIFAMRLALEPHAARCSATAADEGVTAPMEMAIDRMASAAAAGDVTAFARFDQQFHGGIMAAAGNRRAAAAIAELRDLTRALGPSTAGESRTLEDILDEHVPILEAIRAQDPARARVSMSRHLVRTGRLLVQQCERRGEVDAWRSWHRLVDEDV